MTSSPANSERQTTNSPTWKQAWGNINFRVHFCIAILVIVCFGITFPTFFDFLEAREGPQLKDAFISVFPAADVSWVVFTFLYAGIFASLFSLSKYPLQLLIALETYCIVTMMRMLSITLFPLNPPIDYIPLREPFAQLFVNHHRIISKDLFFSGHVATICALFFPLVNKRTRIFVFISVLGVAVTVIIQRVHYTIDVAFAPLATFICYYISKKFLTRFNF